MEHAEKTEPVLDRLVSFFAPQGQRNPAQGFVQRNPGDECHKISCALSGRRSGAQFPPPRQGGNLCSTVDPGFLPQGGINPGLGSFAPLGRKNQNQIYTPPRRLPLRLAPSS